MLELIKENKFQELKEKIQTSANSFQIHKFLGDVLSKTKVEIDAESFNAQKYQEEFFEGFKIYKALNQSEIQKDELKIYSNILVELAFKTGGFIKIMSNTAMKNGMYLSDISNTYEVHPELRERFQEFIELLKEKNDLKSIANIAIAKAQVTTSIGNLLNNEDIGHDMLQFSEGYVNVGQTEKAIDIYKYIMNEFECESVKNSSGLFPEISQVDTRPKAEIEIFENARNQYEKLSGDILPEIKRVHIEDDKQAQKLVERVIKKGSEIMNEQQNKKNGLFDKLRNIFKK